MMAAAASPTPSAPDSVRTLSVPWARIEQFVGQFTHDVRNGLNALELQLTLLGEISANAEVIAEVKAIRNTLMDVTRQLQLVKAFTGPILPHLLSYPAKDFFEDLRDRFGRLHPDAAGKVAWKIATGDVALEVDPELSLSALLELLANAIHFGGESPAISLLAEAPAAGGITVTLRESHSQPPAVAAGDWGRTPLLTTRRGAYGLGLFRVRRIIEAQGGTLRADYSAANNVLTTMISLPATV